MLYETRRAKGIRRSIVVLAALLAACSNSPSEPARKVESTPIDPSTTGAISVRVTYNGDVPAPKPIVMSSAPQCALSHSGPVFEETLVAADGKLSNAIVWIAKGLETFSFAPPTTPVVIDQVGCVYKPHAAVAMVGQPVEFVNSDAEAHNVHGFPNIIGAWNFILSRKGSRRTLTFDKPEVGVLISCDIHPWMRAYLGITEHPYAAVSAADGSAVLRGVPAGNHTVAVWHEVLGKKETQVTLPAKGSVQIEIDLTR